MDPVAIEVQYAKYMANTDASRMFPLDDPFADLSSIDLDLEPGSPEFEPAVAELKREIAESSDSDSPAMRHFALIKQWQLKALEAKHV